MLAPDAQAHHAARGHQRRDRTSRSGNTAKPVNGRRASVSTPRWSGCRGHGRGPRRGVRSAVVAGAASCPARPTSSWSPWVLVGRGLRRRRCRPVSCSAGDGLLVRSLGLDGADGRPGGRPGRGHGAGGRVLGDAGAAVAGDAGHGHRRARPVISRPVARMPVKATRERRHALDCDRDRTRCLTSSSCRGERAGRWSRRRCSRRGSGESWRSFIVAYTSGPAGS